MAQANLDGADFEGAKLKVEVFSLFIDYYDIFYMNIHSFKFNFSKDDNELFLNNACCSFYYSCLTAK